MKPTKHTKQAKSLSKTPTRMTDNRSKTVKPYCNTPPKRSPAWFAHLINYLYN